MILIVSIADDLHALQIHQRLKEMSVECRLIECDTLHGNQIVSWEKSDELQASQIRDFQGELVRTESIKTIWWRRSWSEQRLAWTVDSTDERKLIDNECRGALTGILSASFHGKWISHPDATTRASNKLLQLETAEAHGFKIPATLISQFPEQVRDFCMRHRTIVKPVVGKQGSMLFAQYVDDVSKFSDDSIAACPAIYQEYIPGTKHIRLNCFGSKSFAATIETEELDWRANLNVPVTPWDIPCELHHRIRLVLDALQLEMGVVDLKLKPDGEVVWLEVNPQGQFLFLEGITGMNLTDAFCEYLASA